MPITDMFGSRSAAMAAKTDDWSRSDGEQSDDEGSVGSEESRDELDDNGLNLDQFFTSATSLLGSAFRVRGDGESTGGDSTLLDDASVALTEVSTTISSALSGAAKEASSMADDVKSIIEADVDADVPKPKTKKLSPIKKKMMMRELSSVKGSPATLAKEIKKFEKLERKVAKEERKIMKSENHIYKAEQKQMEARWKIKALSEKFELRGIVKYIDGDEDADVGEVLLDGAGGIVNAGDDAAMYIPRLAKAIEKKANDAIFPVE